MRLRPSQSLVRRPDRDERRACKQPAGRLQEVSQEEERGRGEAEIWAEDEWGRRANLYTLKTTSSAARINTFTYWHSLGRHICRQLSVTSATS